MADYSWLAGIGSGLSELGDQLTRRQVMKLAQEEKELERKRQQEQDALGRAQMLGAEAKGLRGENFELSQKGGFNVNPAAANNSPDAMKAILNRAASGTTGEEYQAPISGDTYRRDPANAPNAIKQAQEAERVAQRATLAEIAANSKREIEGIRQAAQNGRWNTVSGNVERQQQGADRRWDAPSGNVQAQQAGANQRAATAAAGRGAGGKVTEAQAKAETFSGLMEAAEGEIAKNPWGTRPLNAASEIALKGDGTGLAANVAAALARSKMSPEQQRAIQSRYQFTQAALYAFSGQSAPNSEVAKNIAIFFPQSGETDPTIAEQKARMRATATMLLAKRKAGLIDGEVPMVSGAPVGDAMTTGSGAAAAARARMQNAGRP